MSPPRSARLSATQRQCRSPDLAQHIPDQLRGRGPKVAALTDDSEHDTLACITFATEYRTKLHSSNPLEPLSKEVNRRANIVGSFSNEASIVRLIGAVCMSKTINGHYSAATCRSKEWPNFPTPAV